MSPIAKDFEFQPSICLFVTFDAILSLEQIERLVDKDGVYEGDIMVKVEIPEAEKGQCKLIKNYIKIKEGRGV